jgi:hypothetical protein
MYTAFASIKFAGASEFWCDIFSFTRVGMPPTSKALSYHLKGAFFIESLFDVSTINLFKF